MALKPIVPSLRRFVNDSNDIVRIDVRVDPGAELEVDDVVAAQLPASFKNPDYVSKRDKKRAAYAKAAAPVAPDEVEPADEVEAEPVA